MPNLPVVPLVFGTLSRVMQLRAELPVWQCESGAGHQRMIAQGANGMIAPLDATVIAHVVGMRMGSTAGLVLVITARGMIAPFGMVAPE